MRIHLLLLAGLLLVTGVVRAQDPFVALPPRIYVRFDKIGGKFFGPTAMGETRTDCSHVPGTNLLLNVTMQSSTLDEITLRFDADCAAGLTPMKHGQPIPAIAPTTVTVPLSKNSSFRIFGSIDVTTSSSFDPDAEGYAEQNMYETPLVRAIMGQDDEGVRSLILENNALVTTGAMQVALEKGTPAMMKLVWNRAPGFCSEMTYAISQGATTADLEQMLARGVPVERDWDDLVTPLGMAVRLGNVPVAQWLISHGAYVTSQGGAEPMYLAMNGESAEMVSLLIKNGAHADPPRMYEAVGLPDFSQPGVEAKRLAIIKVMIDADVLAKATGADKAGFLLEACEKKAPEILSYFLQLGIDPLSKLPTGETVLDAVKKDYAGRANNPTMDGLQPEIDILEAAARRS